MAYKGDAPQAALCGKDMNVVIQNGCEHTLTRKELESMLCFFPSSWGSGVKTIALYQGKGPSINTEYYKKEKIFGLFCPKEAQGKQMKIEAIQEMLVGLAYIAESNDLPKKLGKSAWNYCFEQTEAIREKCLKTVERDAT